jgi:hypothetical protein
MSKNAIYIVKIYWTKSVCNSSIYNVYAGNALVILVVQCDRQVESKTNFLLGQLALADLCVGVFCVMQSFMAYLSKYVLLYLSETVTLIMLGAAGCWVFSSVRCTCTCRRSVTLPRCSSWWPCVSSDTSPSCNRFTLVAYLLPSGSG